MIYIDTGKTVRMYSTNGQRRIEKIFIALLDSIEELVNSETHEGYEVAIVAKEDNK